MTRVHRAAQQLHRHAPLRSLLAGAALLLLAAIAAATWMLVQRDYERQAEAALADAQRGADKLALRTAELLDSTDQTLRVLQFLQLRNELPPLSSLGAAGLLAGGQARAVYVTDPRGFVGDSTSNAIALNIADEDDFKRHKRDPGSGLQIAPAVSDPLADGAVVRVSRRLERSGTFDGVAVATLPAATLLDTGSRFEAAGSAVGLLGRDGVFRLRLTDGRLQVPAAVDVAALQTQAARMRAERRPLASPVDGVSRFIAVAAVDRYPLLSVVGIDATSALADHRRNRTVLQAAALVIASVVLAALLLVFAQAGALDRERARARRSDQAFRATLEGSLDAVSILRAHRAADGTLTDMRVEDCNAPAAGLLGLTREQCVGRLLCELAPSIRRDGHLAYYERAMQSGRPSEHEIPSGEPALAGHWLHHQLVPLDDGVALISRDVTEQHQRNRALAAQALTDPLTGLGNRQCFDRALEAAAARAERSGQPVALLFVDLDGFKQINDTRGHAAGDRVLSATAQRLQQSVRGGDLVCRLGGDEFTVLVEAGRDGVDLEAVCERIVRMAAMPHVLDGELVYATASVGGAWWQAGERLDELRRRADRAMYAAKGAGKSVWRVAGQVPA